MMISQVEPWLPARHAEVCQGPSAAETDLLKRIQAREANTHELNFWDQELAHAGGLIFWARADAHRVISCRKLHQQNGTPQRRASRICSSTYRPSLGGLDELDSPIDDLRVDRSHAEGPQNLVAGKLVPAPPSLALIGTTCKSKSTACPPILSLPGPNSALLRWSMRLAEASYLRRALGDDPVVLLDDVLSELDARRRKGVLEYIDTFQQTLVTTADPDRLRDVMTKASGTVPGFDRVDYRASRSNPSADAVRSCSAARLLSAVSPSSTVSQRSPCSSI
jgi:DNA replication and repair protein RecF